MEINIAAALVAALGSGLTGYCIGTVLEKRRHYSREFQTRRELRALEQSLHESKMESKPHNRVASVHSSPARKSHSSPASTDHGFTSGLAVGSSFSSDSGCSSSSSSSPSSDSGSCF